MIIHTVKLTKTGLRGVALGIDEGGKRIRIWLLTPSAINHAWERLSQFARTLDTEPMTVARRSPLGLPVTDREWSLQ